MILDGSLDDSTAGGTQEDVHLELVKEEGDDGDWHFRFNGVDVGFWPHEMFNVIDESANLMQWGGEIVNSTQVGSPPFHTTTHMGGDGTFGTNAARYKHAAYQRDLRVVTSEPVWWGWTRSVASTSILTPPPADTYYDNCYDTYNQFSSDPDWQRYMFHGGIGWHKSGSTSNWCACGDGLCYSPENSTNCPQDC